MLLGEGRYRVALLSSGAGGSFQGRNAVTRWTRDDTLQHEGFFLFIRDLETGSWWSATAQPGGRRADRYRVTNGNDFVEITRDDADIETTMRVAVPGHDHEIRC